MFPGILRAHLDLMIQVTGVWSGYQRPEEGSLSLEEPSTSAVAVYNSVHKINGVVEEWVG